MRIAMRSHCIPWWQLLPSNIRSAHCSADKCPALTNLLVIIVGGIPIAMPTVLSVTLALGAFRLAKEGAIVARMSAVEEMAGEQLIHPVRAAYDLHAVSRGVCWCALQQPRRLFTAPLLSCIAPRVKFPCEHLPDKAVAAARAAGRGQPECLPGCNANSGGT